MGRTGYMLDTTEFNAVAKGQVAPSAYAGISLFATHVQLDELNNTPCEHTRAQLLAALEAIGPENRPTESAVYDISRWDEAKHSAEDELFEKMLARLIELDGKDRGQNQRRDALIAETAIKNGLTLVSADQNLRTVMQEFGGKIAMPCR